jgi:hypothetical protein
LVLVFPVPKMASGLLFYPYLHAALAALAVTAYSSPACPSYLYLGSPGRLAPSCLCPENPDCLGPSYLCPENPDRLGPSYLYPENLGRLGPSYLYPESLDHLDPSCLCHGSPGRLGPSYSFDSTGINFHIDNIDPFGQYLDPSNVGSTCHSSAA